MEVKKEDHVVSEAGALRSTTKGKGRYDCILLGYPHMIFRLARLLEQGIESGYSAGNWKKGTDLRRWLEGGFRHLCQFADGQIDEDHLIAAIWNLMSLGETKHLIDKGVRSAELDNLPFTPKPGDQRMGPDGQEEVWSKWVNKDGRLKPIVGGTSVDRVLPDLRPPTFYICGPMRGLPFLNFPAFDGARDLGRSLGYEIISPADMDRLHGIDPIEDPASPERARDRDPDLTRTLAKRDVAVIFELQKDRGDGLALLPGCEHSVGGMAEIRLALWLGLKFVRATDWTPIDIAAELGIKT